MAIQLDHIIVPSRDKVAAAKLLADLLDVPWTATTAGAPFSAVYVNDGLTFDFDERTEEFSLLHYCFRVSDEEFDAILERIRAAQIPYRSNVFGAVDFKVNTWSGGRGVYWNEPGGHQWEMLTVSYARQSG